MDIIILTRQNAHRVTMVRRKDDPQSAPIAFHWRGDRRIGIGNFNHLLGEGDAARIIREEEFKQWAVTATKHPGYLESLWNAAYDAHYWSSQHPDIRGEDEITSYEQELHADLQTIPESRREQYLTTYKDHLSGVWVAESRVASAFVTGPAGFNQRRNERARNAYDNKYSAFRQWRERTLKAIEKYKETQKTPEERCNKLWTTVQADINRTAAMIHTIDLGQERGYSRALFVSGLCGRVGTHANNGHVEIVDRAIELVREWNAKCQKPIITERHSFFKLPEVARCVRQKAEEMATRENKEVVFEGGRLVWNYAEDRLQILFNKIPDKEFRQRMHRKFRFNWSRTNEAWQRQLTDNAVQAARRLLNLKAL